MELLPEIELVCIGLVTGPHGLNGEVKIRSFMENPSDIARFGLLTDKSGRKEFKIELIAEKQRFLIARLSGIEDRNASEAIKGMELFILREMLPELDDDEFYYSDLIGLSVENCDGEIIGVVGAVDNYGAGEILEVNMNDGGVEIFHMSKNVVPLIDLENRRVVIDPPTEIFVANNKHIEEIREKK